MGAWRRIRLGLRTSFEAVARAKGSVLEGEGEGDAAE